MPYLVMGAGDAEFDGFYEVDTTRIGGKRDRIDSAACYRKVGSSCTMNYNRTDHAWFMCKDHRGAWYKNTTESDVPPARNVMGVLFLFATCISLIISASSWTLTTIFGTSR